MRETGRLFGGDEKGHALTNLFVWGFDFAGQIDDGRIDKEPCRGREGGTERCRILTHCFVLQRGPVVSLETCVLFDVGKAWKAGWKISGVESQHWYSRKADEFSSRKRV
jgi:hypothetical protein